MEAVRKLISDYRVTWETVIRDKTPLKDLDRFFNVPCFMVALDGAMTQYTSQQSITEFNRSRLEAFRSEGAYSATLRAVDVITQGSHLSLAIVNWELTRQDGSLERAWRHYYTILASESSDAPKIIISAFQTGS